MCTRLMHTHVPEFESGGVGEWSEGEGQPDVTVGEDGGRGGWGGTRLTTPSSLTLTPHSLILTLASGMRVVMGD